MAVSIMVIAGILWLLLKASQTLLIMLAFTELFNHPLPFHQTIFPANNSIVPSAVTQGYFEIDTWCDATIPANQALTFSTTGNIQINANTGVYWENGTSGQIE